MECWVFHYPSSPSLQYSKRPGSAIRSSEATCLVDLKAAWHDILGLK
jgi:hypothetical protein